MKRLAAFFAAVAAWALAAQPALAAIGTPTSLSTNPGYTTNGGTTNALSLTAADTPVGTLIIVPTAIQGTTTITSVADSAANSYAANASAQAGFRMAAYLNNVSTVDLPAPCTVTATETSTTLVVTAAVTCASSVTFTVGQALSGTGITGSIATSSCTLVSGAATCTVSGGSTQASPQTVTVSSTITSTFNSAAGKMAETAFTLSGIATSSPAVNNASGTGTSTGGAFTPVSITPTNGTDTNGEFVGVCIWFASGATGDGYTEDTGAHGWVVLPAGASGTGPFGSSTNVLAHCAYQKVTTNSALTWSPTWTPSRLWGYITFGLKSAGAAAGAPKGPLLGVGP